MLTINSSDINYIEWYNKCFKKFKNELKLWDDNAHHTAGYAGDLLSGAIVYNYFDDRVKAICNWILNNTSLVTLTLISAAKGFLLKHK